MMKNKNIFTFLLVIITCMAFALTGCNNTPDSGNNNEDNHTYYTVTFDSKGGSAVESQRIMEGNPVRRPDLPTYEGHTFNGWYKDEAATDYLWNFDTDRVTSNLTLYARWNAADVLPEPTESQILIAYFSATNNTENIAKRIADITGGTMYEILPKVPYTSADLNYNTDCRANREQNDSTCRPGIDGSVSDMASYDIVFIGYPIWWGQAPKIMYTFLESYEFAGKTIIPFCTSGSSGIGSSATNLSSSASDATWLSGQRFSGSASKATVENWINGLNLNITKEQEKNISVKI